MVPKETTNLLDRLGIEHPQRMVIEPDNMAEIIYSIRGVWPQTAKRVYESLPEDERIKVDGYLSHWESLEKINPIVEGLRLFGWKNEIGCARAPFVDPASLRQREARINSRYSQDSGEN